MAHVISIFVPGNIEPFERAERFIDPLETALEHGGLGEVIEEGTHLKTIADRQLITGCRIIIEVKNFDDAIPVIHRILTESGASAETTITVMGKTNLNVFKLGELPK